MNNLISVQAFTAYGKAILFELKSPVGVTLPNSTYPNELKFVGLWDTGATGCAITKRVADEIGVQPCGLIEVAGVHGIERVHQYLVDIHLLNNISIHNVDASELSECAGCDVLIGMNIISMGDFAVSNYNNETVFTFRIPSLATTDYLTQLPNNFQLINLDKNISRNSQCPCGSGKKYKKCCGKLK